MSHEESLRLLPLFLASLSRPPESFIIDTTGYSREEEILYVLYVYPFSLSLSSFSSSRYSTGILCGYLNKSHEIIFLTFDCFLRAMAESIVSSEIVIAARKAAAMETVLTVCKTKQIAADVERKNWNSGDMLFFSFISSSLSLSLSLSSLFSLFPFFI